jgi:hypothetical protein
MAAPSNAEIIATCILSAPPIDQQLLNKGLAVEGIITSVSNNVMYIGTTDSGYIDFVEPPFPVSSIGRIQITTDHTTLTNSLSILSGSNASLNNGRIQFGNLNVTYNDNSSTAVDTLNCTNNNQKTSVYDVFGFRSLAPIQIVQGSTNQITHNKTLFTYPSVAGVNVIRFQSELLTKGMVFLKDTSGLNNLAGVTMSLDILPTPPPPAPPPRAPILTINNIPIVNGNCSAMLIII